jgi:hypothetical protein
MNTQSKPYAPTTPLVDLHPSRFLKVEDLRDRWKVTQLTVTIAEITEEETIPNPKDLDPTTADAKNPKGKPRVEMQPVLYFRSKDGTVYPRGYLMSSKADTASLAIATKAQTVGETIGKKVTIIIGEHRGKAVLRISQLPPME